MRSSMKQFHCGDVVPGCKAVFEAESEALLFAGIQEHARKDHGMKEIPQALVEQIRTHIREKKN